MQAEEPALGPCLCSFYSLHTPPWVGNTLCVGLHGSEGESHLQVFTGRWSRLGKPLSKNHPPTHTIY